MRYIPIFENAQGPDQDWGKKADQITEALVAEPDSEKRKEIIENNKAHWGKLKGWLLAFSNGKCWYSEAKDTVQYWEVEHFRPKNAALGVNGEKIHDGYWWLAFEWHNYRLAGEVINRKKGAYFPLLKNSYLAKSSNDPWEDESPVLLDPTDQEDCGLVFFDETGRLIPAPGLDNEDINRVEVSAERYNLNYHLLMDARRTVWNTCYRLAEEYVNLATAVKTTKSIAKRTQAKEKLKQLRQLVSFSTPFSKTAMVCIEAFGNPKLAHAVSV